MMCRPPLPSIASRFVLMLGLSIAGAAHAEPAATPPDPLEPARAMLRDHDFTGAVKAIDSLPATRAGSPGEAAYLESLALFHSGQLDAAVRAAQSSVADTNSAWCRKAAFLQARALVDLKRFQDAELIYAAEANRLLSIARKRDVAGVLVAFADELATEPAADALDAPPPDYGKACGLYGKVLEMQIGRDQRAEVLFKQACAWQRAKQPGQALQAFTAYLDAFDPDWTGGTESGDRARLRSEHPEAPGAQRMMARLHLAEVCLDAEQPEVARRHLEDLLRLLASPAAVAAAPALTPALADIHWLRLRTHGFPTNPADLDNGVQAARDFLRQHPDDRRAVQVAFDLGEAYRQAGRSDDAVRAYRDFVDGKGFALPPGAALTQKDSASGKSPAEVKEEGQRLALYQIGTLLFAQGKFDAAVVDWQTYVTRFPNGPHWSACQEGIINAEYQRGLSAVSEKRDADARTLFDAFLAAHPLDPRARRILFTYGQVRYVKAQELERHHAASAEVEAEYRAAIDEWSRLISKYPSTEESSLALYRTGQVYEEKLGQLEQALDQYRRLTWGSCSGQAQGRIAVMTTKELTLSTECTFRTGEPAVVKLRARNVPKVTVKQYTLDLEEFFRKTHGIGSVADLDVSLIQPDRTTEVALEGYAKFKPMERDVEIPFTPGKPGVCVVNVSEDDWEATTLVIRSDLEVIAKSSRREVLAFVEDMVRKAPAAGVKVLLSDGKAIIATGLTGKDGVYRQRRDTLKNLADVRVFAVRDGHTAAQNLTLTGLQLGSGLKPRGFVYTDRPVYKPGSTVAVRGILRDVVDGGYVVPGDESFTVSVSDAKLRLLREETLKLSEFGTFHTSLQLPDGAPEGTYTVTARAERRNREPLVFQGTFSVRTFKPEKIRMELDFPRQVYFRGEPVEGIVHAAYYWGEPVVGRLVRTTLADGRTLTGSTDAEGKLAFTFDSTGLSPGQPMMFAASLEGESVSVQRVLTLARRGFSIAVTPAQELALAGEPVDVTVAVTSADGGSAAEDVTLTVLRLEETKPDPVLHDVPWEQRPASTPAEVTVGEFKLHTDGTSGKAVQALALEKGGRYVLRATGMDRFKQVIIANGLLQVSDAEDATKLRLFSDGSTLKVGEHAGLRLHARLADGLALLTHEGEDILQYRIVPVQAGYTDIGFDVGHAHFPNFRVAVAMMDGRELRTAEKAFTVERELKVSVRPLQEAYAPGAEGQVELAVTDQLGKPVRAEFSLAVVDEGVFAVQRDSTPAILDYFQRDARRHAEFRTASTCGFRYDGVSRPVTKAIVEETERLERADRDSRLLRYVRRNMKSGEGKDGGAAAYSGPSGPEYEPPPADAPASVLVANLEYGDTYTVSGEGVVMKGLHASRSAGPRESVVASHGGGGSGGRGIAESPRRELPDEGRWFPNVVTGPDGKAIVRVPMPEKTTEWRIQARGCSVDTLVGEGQAKTLTKKDFFVEVKVPPTLQEGDALRVVARVHNLTDYAGPVSLRLALRGRGATNDIELAAQEKTCTVAAKGGAEVAFDGIDIPGVVGVAVTVEARAGERHDALALDVPVRAYGLEFAAQGGGTTSSDAGLFLSLPADRAYRSRWLLVSVGTALSQSVMDLALADAAPVPCEILRMPPVSPGWGGTDGSELLAKVSGAAYAQRAGAAEADAQRLREAARGLAASLMAAQREDGGWAWEGTQSGSDWAASSRAFWALVEARDLGIPVYTDTVARAQGYLESALQSFGATDNDAKAVVLHALSVNRAADFANCNRLHRDRAVLGNAASAYLALAFLNLDRPDFAKELLDLLEARGEVGAGVDGKRMRSWEPKAPHAWMRDRVETTAMALLALARGRPGSPAGAAAAEYLMHERGCLGITPAKARGPVVAALAAWTGGAQVADADGEVTVAVNGETVTNIVARGAGPTTYVSVGGDRLRDGTNTVSVHVAGRGTVAYAATLRGFSPDATDPKSWAYPHVRERHTYHAQLEYRGRPLGVNSTSPVTTLEAGQRADVLVDIWESSLDTYLVIEETLPSGTALVEGSLTGNFTHVERRPSSFLLFYPPNMYVQDFRYQLIGTSPGRYRVLPTVLRDAINPARMRLGPPGVLTVLAPGEVSGDTFEMNREELFALGRACFDDGDFGKALEYLAALFARDREWQERDTARMLLWIYTMPEHADPRKIVEMFEILRERYPQLEIPFDKILAVGRAYRDIGEFERACLVYRATISASYVNDSGVSAVLQDEGRLLGSVDYQEALWRQYPDSAEVISSYFALAQTLCEKAAVAHTLPKEGDRAPEKIGMLTRGAGMLGDFLAFYPNDPLADDAAFSLCNTWLDLKQYPQVVARSRRFAETYTNSTLVSSFQYMQGLGLFWQSRYQDALAAVRAVAEGESPDKHFARYIVGQIYHAEGKPADAIAWYGKVRGQYRDAEEAIQYFEEKRIALDEVSILRPGEPVNVTMRYRNVRDAFLQVYRVDLMKLVLREKNLRNITQVRLAGIKPELEQAVALGDGRDYVEKEKVAKLAIREEGAYLVICRGDDLFTSGLVLVTPLKIEVQEDPTSGQVRANVLDAVKGGYRPGVHVKAIGSADTEFKGGETDLRGIVAIDGLRGNATVIARDGQARYAFYRGDRWLGVPEEASPPDLPSKAPVQVLDYQYNLRQAQQSIQTVNGIRFEQMRRTRNGGVQVDQAF